MLEIIITNKNKGEIKMKTKKQIMTEYIERSIAIQFGMANAPEYFLDALKERIGKILNEKMNPVFYE